MAAWCIAFASGTEDPGSNHISVFRPKQRFLKWDTRMTPLSGPPNLSANPSLVRSSVRLTTVSRILSRVAAFYLNKSRHLLWGWAKLEIQLLLAADCNRVRPRSLVYAGAVFSTFVHFLRAREREREWEREWERESCNRFQIWGGGWQQRSLVELGSTKIFSTSLFPVESGSFFINSKPPFFCGRKCSRRSRRAARATTCWPFIGPLTASGPGALGSRVSEADHFRGTTSKTGFQGDLRRQSEAHS
jgi:hypothetical protein